VIEDDSVCRLALAKVIGANDVRYLDPIWEWARLDLQDFAEKVGGCRDQCGLHHYRKANRKGNLFRTEQGGYITSML